MTYCDIFKDLLDSDLEFRYLVNNNYEVWPYLIMNTDLDDITCNEIEHLADKWYSINKVL